MAIERQIRPKFKTKNDAIVARLRAEAGADAPRDPKMMIKKRTAELAYLMALVHGGEWRVEGDQEIGYVLISRRTV